MTDLDELEALLAKATPGEWHLCQHLKGVEEDAGCSCGYRGVVFGPEKDGFAVFQPGHDPSPTGEEFTEPQRYPRETEITNSQFIVALHNAAPDLIAKARRVERLEAILRAIIEYYEDRAWGTDAPGHAHKVPGVWDGTGKDCEWCAAWNAARAALKENTDATSD